MMRKFTPLLALVATLAACHSAPRPAPTRDVGGDTGGNAAPDARQGVALTAARLVLPAVSGNPGGLYFTLTNGSKASLTLSAVHVDGAPKAEMHQTIGGAMKALANVPVPAGGQITFAPGGRHVMLFDLSTSLVAHGATEMTLTFSDGDKVSAPVDVVAAGSTDAPMAM